MSRPPCLARFRAGRIMYSSPADKGFDVSERKKSPTRAREGSRLSVEALPWFGFEWEVARGAINCR